ncbi:zinc finger protein 706-like [Lycaon pictus]
MRVTGGTRHGLLWSPLSPPWWVEVVEVVLGTLPLPLPHHLPQPSHTAAVSPVSLMQDCPGPDIACGQQKIQYQQRNAQKQAGQKRKQAHDQKASAKAALIYTWIVCRTQMPDLKTFQQHFENKHPKTPLSLELADIQA